VCNQRQQDLIGTPVVLKPVHISFYVPYLKGPEALFENHPDLFAPFIAAHIVIGFFSIWLLGRHEENPSHKPFQQL